MMDWVLGSLRGEDAALVNEAVERAVKAIECCIQNGVDKAMNQFNSK